MRVTNKEFSHNHCHTDLSNLRMKDSIVKVEDLIKYANKLGNKGVCITDHGTISGHIKMINTYNKLKKQNEIKEDFKIGLGNEIYLVSKLETQKLRESNERINFYHLILIAKDLEGHKQLRKLNSKAWKDNYMVYRSVRRVPNYYEDLEEVIGDNKGHLICTSACLGSLIGVHSNMLLELSKQERDTSEEEYEIKGKIADFIEWCLDLFGEDFYLELQPNTCEEQVFYNKLLVRLSKAYDIKLTVATDVHYLDENYKDTHKAFLTSDKDNTSNREVDYFYETTRFFEVEEIYNNLLTHIEEDTITQAIVNAGNIMDKVSYYDWFGDPIIPLTPLPKEEEWYPVDLNEIIRFPNIYSMYNDEFPHNRYLVSKLMEGLEYRNISKYDRDEYLDRIDIECRELYNISRRFNQPVGGYLTTMQVIMEVLWKNGIVCPGRGSAVCYVSDYLLDITQVDPLKINKIGIVMKHWRFLTADRPGMPDIDIDTASHLKNTNFNAVKEYFESIGGTCVRVATFRTETSKSAVRTACRGKGVNDDVANYLSTLIPVERGNVRSIKEVYYGNKDKDIKPITEFVNIVDSFSDKNLLEAMLNIEGLISGCSSHASGVLCLNRPLEESSSFMRTPSGELITSFDLHEEESVQGLKYDFLITNAMSLIQLTMEQLVDKGYMEWQGSLKATYNKYLLPEVINIEDEKMWDLIRRGKILNLFQFETIVNFCDII